MKFFFFGVLKPASYDSLLYIKSKKPTIYACLSPCT